MPISVSNKSFEDMFSNSLNFYQANAGDKHIFTCNIFEQISVFDSSINYLSYTSGTNQITWSGGNFLTEGFQVGDEISVIVYNANGTVDTTTIVNILVVEASFIIVDAFVDWKSSTQNVEIIVNYKTNEKRNGLELNLNFIQQAASLTPNSLIDGSVNKILFDLTGTTTGQVVNGTQVSIKSGQYEVIASITDTTTYPNNRRTYALMVEFIQGGAMLENAFNFGSCLKAYFGTVWQRTYGNPNNNYLYAICDNADTGWYDEAYNTGVIDATLVSGIASLEYNTTQTGTISIDSVSTDFGFGSGYIPTDDTYFKNQTIDQSELSMFVETQTSAAPILLTSPLNPSGAGYTLEFSNPVTVGTITTWDWEFIPNNDFETFMEAREDGDRLFYIWAKYGDVNLLLFNGQLTAQAKVGDPLNMVTHRFVDHSQNIVIPDITKFGFEGNVEDDLAFLGVFLVPINSDITYAKAEIWAVNSVDNEEFLLNTVNFDFASVPKVGGYYPINQSQTVITTLPTTSEKRQAVLSRYNALDTATDYGLSVNFPFFYNWEYWIAQPNAAGDFYPNDQTRNWVPYGTFTNWNLQLRITANIDGLDSQYIENIVIKDYDSDANINQTMQLEVVSTNQMVNVIVEGELHKIYAYHTLVSNVWDTTNVWGMITIEPTESAPRWICSTVIPFDNNQSNPLTPISGLFCSISFPAPNIAKMECYFDSNKINLENGVKFTSKIKGCSLDPAFFKLLTDGTIKYTTDGLPKLLTI